MASDWATLIPATAEAAVVVECTRDEGVLISSVARITTC
jgi:hypothetical protein